MPLPTLSRLVDAALEATVVGSFTRLGPVVRARVDNWDDAPEGALVGRTALVTGATSGIGAATARQLAVLGAHVHLAGRDPAKLRTTVDELTATGASVEGQRADLARLDDVRALAERIESVDIVAHVAGIMAETRQDTADGIELTTQVHVVAPHLLTTLLLDRLRESDDPRVITVSSGGMYTQRLDVAELFDPPGEFSGSNQYARAKRAQVELNREWAARHRTAGIGFHAMHPGWADTPGLEASLPGFRRVLGATLRSADEGADTATWLAWAPEVKAPGGEFWLDRRPRRIHSLPRTTAPDGEATRLWTAVEHAAGLPG